MNKQELIAEYKQRLEEAEIRHEEMLPNMHISKAELQERMCNYRLFITDLESLDVFGESDLIGFGKKCFYKGFEKSEKDDANCFTAWREESPELLSNILTTTSPNQQT